MISLPKKWIDQNSVQKGQELELIHLGIVRRIRNFVKHMALLNTFSVTSEAEHGEQSRTSIKGHTQILEHLLQMPLTSI